jgi:4-diphosphocytidyl-2-C-methyl-D-erythritol kinase
MIRLHAYAKVNLTLFLGRGREDGRHDLVTVFESVDLADELRIDELPSGTDEVNCPGVDGPNLVTDALAGLRAAGWAAPPLLIEIDKRIPVAAGMGGGSADAAALLRHAPELAPIAAEKVRELAAGLGSDVPSQLDPGASLGLGAGDIVSPLPDLGEHALLVIPQSFGLSTAEVYRAADELDRARTRTELLSVQVGIELAAAKPDWRLPPSLTVNELQAAALSLRPEIARALAAASAAGAERAIVCGSGPTVIGLFWGPGAYDRARAAAALLSDRYPAATAARPVRRGVEGPAPNP